MTCNSCGGDLLASEKVCKYCGAANPNYVAPVQNEAPRPSAPRFDNQRPQPSYIPTKAPFKLGTFILLLIVFWPAAIIYAISKSGHS